MQKQSYTVDQQIANFVDSLSPKDQARLRQTGSIYDYILAHPNGAIFYVGKGKNGRIDDHEIETRKGEQSKKCNIIREIWDEGEDIIKRKIAYFNNDADALRIEALLIAFLGIKNLTNGSSGGDGRPGKDWERVNIKMSPESRKLTEGLDRSKLIDELIRAHFGRE